MKQRYKISFIQDIDAEPIQIGIFHDKEKASDEAYEYLSKHGLRADVDTKEEITESLIKRGFFLSAYAPREVIMEEILI